MATSVTKAQQDQIAQLYVSLFNRAPDAGGFAGWVESLAKGTSLNVIAQDFYLSPEGQATYSRALTNQQFVEAFYTKFLGRNLTTEDKGGITYWVGRLGETGATHGAIAAEIIKNIVNYTGADPVVLASKAIIDAKVLVGEHYALTLNGNVAGAAAAVDGVTNATTAAAKIAELGTSGTIGTTLPLTDGIDLFVGTAGNDTFVAVNDAKERLALGDDIKGSAGVDTLKLVNANATVAAANLTDIEKVTVTQSTAAATAIDAANWVGVKEVTSLASSKAIKVINLQNLVTVGFDSTVEAVEVAFAAAAVVGTADSLGVTLNKAGSSTTAAALTANGNEALAIASNGTVKNYLDATAADTAVTAITVTGDAALVLTIDTNTVTSFDASANKGGVALTGTLVGTAAAGLSVKGSVGVDSLTVDLTNKAVVDAGAGNDTIALTNVASLTSTDSVAGGEGTDTLSLAVADAKTVAANTARSVITGFETLKVTGNFAAAAADAFDISKFGINSLQVTGDVGGVVATTVSGFTSGATVELDLAGTQTNALNIGVKNATDAGTDSDTLNIKLNADVAADAVPGTAAYFTAKVGVEGINILNVNTADSDVTTKGGVEDGYTLALSLADNVTAINVTGSNALKFVSGTATNALKTFDGSALAANLTVDLSGFTGTQGVVVKGGAGVNTITGTGLADIITGGAKADVLVGGAGNDKIDGGAGNDIITGGVGADVLTGGDGVDTFVFTTAGDSIVTAFDTITDLKLGVGGDVMTFGATAGTAAGIKALSAGSQANVTAAATLAAAVNQVLTETTDVANTVAIFTYGTDTYILYNAATASATFDAAADTLVKITGVSGTLDASNFLTA